MIILSVWSWLTPVLVGLVCLLIGGIAGFFIARNVFNRYLEKHPPMTEAQVRNMMKQMGRTPSEKQVRQIMASMSPNQK